MKQCTLLKSSSEHIIRGFALIVLCFLYSCRDSTEVKNSYTNPVLMGFYPDPSICKAEDGYYMVNSTFSYFPGIPIFHSKDLVHWEQIGHVLDRPEQLNLDRLELSQGVFAPTIRYHEGTFYVINTIVNGIGNFYVTATDPKGPWSYPIKLDFGGIDPSFFFDDDGSVYIVHNDTPPRPPEYDGHRAIYLYEFDLSRQQLSEDPVLLVDGGTNIEEEPIWIEGPHIYKINGSYYLTCAEGGTSIMHSQVIFKSDYIDGPYVPYEKNPILTQRHLDPARDDAVTCVGHADLIEDDKGDWWAVFLGCRPYPPEEKYHFNTGRETFMAPVTWVDGWPVINKGNELVKYQYNSPGLPVHVPKNVIKSGNFTERDDFEETSLKMYWNQIRTPREKWFSLTENKGHLRINLRQEKLSELVNPSFIGRRQQHAVCKAVTSLAFKPENTNEMAGLTSFQNDKHYYLMEKALSASGSYVIRLVKSGEQDEIINEIELTDTTGRVPLQLKIEARGMYYGFSFSEDEHNWTVLADSIDGTFLSTETAGGFVGTYFGMYASSNGISSNNYADFDWFEYTGMDPVFEVE